MYNSATPTGPNSEVAFALLRAEQQTSRASTVPSHGTKFLAVICLGLGVMASNPTAFVAALMIGSLALWASFRHEDREAKVNVDRHIDPQTQLPLSTALPLIANDSNVIRSLTGRIAIATVDVPEIASRRVIGDEGAAMALTAAMTHRLRSHGWAGDAAGPFGPLIFLRRPGVFTVVLRDVLEDRTTRWLADRVLRILNEPVAWSGTVIEPRASMGVAAGDVANIENLVTQANDARIRAHRSGNGTVIFAGDTLRSATEDLRDWALVAADGTVAGRILDSPQAPESELFTAVGRLHDRLERTLAAVQDTAGTWYLPITASVLCHQDTRHLILARVNEVGAHGRLGLIVSSLSDDRHFVEAWRTIGFLRRAGIEIHLDRTEPNGVRRPLPATPVDGVIVSRSEDDDFQLAYDELVAAARPNDTRVLTRAQVDTPAEMAVADRVLTALHSPVQTLSLTPNDRDSGSDGPIYPGLAAQPAKGLVGPVR